MKRGRFIVIEGTDGSGKGTQTKLLINSLKKIKIPVETTDFPQYDEPSSYFVSKYLRGEYGKAEEVGPFRASIFYALDRYDKSFDIGQWLKEGKLVISNRYVSANMGHQAGKISDKVKRDKYLGWLNDLEYKIFEIPKPDLTILLNMPPKIAQGFVDKKEARKYTKGKKRDIHEADLKHLERAHNAYLYVAKKYGWTVIDCVKNGEVLSIEAVHDLILKKVKNSLKL